MSRDRTPIRAVLFDLDGTLYRLGPIRRKMAARLLARFLWQPRRARRRIRNLSAYRRALESVRHESPEEIAAAGGVRARQRAVALQFGADARTLDEDVRSWMGERPLRFLRKARRKGVLDLLRDLQWQNVQLGVWSDYPVKDKLEALEVAEIFSLRLSADDPSISCLKPWPHGFRFAARMWELPTSAILYVGDRPDVDAVGANAAGMRCVILGVSESEGGFVGIRSVPELRARLLETLESSSGDSSEGAAAQ